MSASIGSHIKQFVELTQCVLALFHECIITFCTACANQTLRMGNAGYKAVQCNSVHLFVLQLFKLGAFNILRNGLLHRVGSFSGETGIEVFKQQVFRGTAASLFVLAADFAAVNLSSQIWRSSFGTNML